MNDYFNQSLLFNNIYCLAKRNGKKIGELETEAGVSPGYISRASKEGSSKPGIDFIMSIAKILNVSLEALLKVDFSKLTPTEKYLLEFFKKLSRDTITGKLEWNCETAETLNNIETDMNGNPEHSCMQVVDSSVVFVSKSFGVNTIIHGDCFNLKLKNGAFLFIWNVSKNRCEVDEKDMVAKEVWVYSSTGLEFLYSNFGETKLADVLESLYFDIVEDCKHPKFNKSTKYIIDAFMRDDLEDDNDFCDDIPF